MNNAGVGVLRKPLIELPVEEWDQMMHTNLRAPYLMIRSFGPMMIAAKSGHIINISSLAGKNILPEGAAYSASKWGLNGLTYSVAEELRQYNVRVSVIAPGSVNTHFGGRQYQGSYPDGPARRRRPGGGHAGDPGADLFCQRSSAAAYNEALGQCRKIFRERSGEPQIPPLRSPGFPVELDGVGELHAPFFTERRIRVLVRRCVAGNPGTLRSG